MSKSVKFTVSMPAAGFKEIETMRRKTGRTRSQFIRDAIRAWRVEIERPSGVREGPGDYKPQPFLDFTTIQELRRRAAAVAGRFRSGLADLSSNHDKYLEEAYSENPPEKGKAEKR
jgi:hypothetical protein